MKVSWTQMSNEKHSFMKRPFQKSRLRNGQDTWRFGTTIMDNIYYIAVNTTLFPERVFHLQVRVHVINVLSRSYHNIDHKSFDICNIIANTHKVKQQIKPTHYIIQKKLYLRIFKETVRIYFLAWINKLHFRIHLTNTEPCGYWHCNKLTLTHYCYLFHYCYCLVYIIFFSFGATAPILALAFLHETFRFISVY
jgi:hypothetical protein